MADEALERIPPVHPGKRLGRYFVVEEIGKGGMGIVVKARDEELGRVVALKFLHPRASGRRQSWTQRMRREAQAMARINHDNVLGIHHVEELDEQLFIVMDYVGGGTLRHWLRGHDRRWQDIVDVFIGAGRGLAAAHEAGLVHRDFKADNVLLNSDGRPLVMDFGLATAASTQESDESRESVSTLDAFGGSLTRAGRMVGTPRSAAPEQFCGKPVDARSDQFSYCVALFEALYGTHPFERDPETPDWRSAITSGRIRERPRGSRVPKAVHQVLVRGMQLDPAERFPSMKALLESLSRVRSRRRAPAVAALGMLAVALGAAAWLPAGAPTCDDASAALAWGDEERAAVTEHIEGLDIAYAPAVLSQVIPRLDRYAEQWRELRSQVCMRAREHELAAEDADRMVSCLARGRERFEATLEAIDGADHRDAPRLVNLAQSLHDLGACTDAEALQAQPWLVDEGSATATALSLAIDRLDTAVSVRPRNDCREDARQILDRAVQIGSDHLTARAQDLVADCASGIGSYGESLRARREAFFRYTAAGDDEQAASAALDAAYTAATGSGDLDEALRWIDTARPLIAHAERPELKVDLLTTEATLLSEQHRLREASANYERALELPLEPVDRAVVLANLGIALGHSGREHQGVERLRQALHIFSEALGDSHPQTATVLLNLPPAFIKTGALQDADETSERALQALQSAFGSRHPRYGVALRNRGDVLLAMRRYQEAEATYAAAARVGRREGPTAERYVDATVRQAVAAHYADQDARAVAVLEPLVSALGTTEPSTMGVHARAWLAYLLYRAGDHDDAREVADLLVHQSDGSEGHDSTEPVRALAAAVALAAADLPASAIDALEPALEDPSSHEALEAALFAATLECELGDPEAAFGALSRAEIGLLRSGSTAALHWSSRRDQWHTAHASCELPMRHR